MWPGRERQPGCCHHVGSVVAWGAGQTVPAPGLGQPVGVCLNAVNAKSGGLSEADWHVWSFHSNFNAMKFFKDEPHALDISISIAALWTQPSNSSVVLLCFIVTVSQLLPQAPTGAHWVAGVLMWWTIFVGFSRPSLYVCSYSVVNKFAVVERKKLVPF